MTVSQPRKAALAAEVALTYLRARRLMSRHDLPGALAGLRERTAGADQNPDIAEYAAYLGHATARTLDALPADSRCLMRSLVLSRLLDRRGIASTLVIGVSPGEEFGAHAWVEIAGQPVLEDHQSSFPRLVEL